MRSLAIVAVATMALCITFIGMEVHARMTRQTVPSAVARIESKAMDRLGPALQNAGVGRPFGGIALVVSKSDRTLDLLVRPMNSKSFVSVKTYPVLAASGTQGPKLREGDRQVPEGVYGIESLNPNSRFHLSMKVDYPSEFDLERAHEEGRHSPGTNIFIHGGANSIGCVAVGDDAIEELFVLCAEIPLHKISVLIGPSHPSQPLERGADVALPDWMEEKDLELRRAWSDLHVR